MIVARAGREGVGETTKDDPRVEHGSLEERLLRCTARRQPSNV